MSSEWAAPNTYTIGFNPSEVNEKYGRSLCFWDWTAGKIIERFDLGNDGLIPLGT